MPKISKQKKASRKERAMHVFIAVSVTLIFLVLLEIGIFVFSELYYAKLNHAEIAYDGDAAYLNMVRETRLGYKQQYCSFLDHCASPYTNGNFSVVAVGERTTVNPCGTADAPTIYVFGGSTTFDAEVLDEDTWASKLSAELCRRGYAVTVRNFGDTGYTSTQETLKLLLQLRNGERPDIVVFYDGYNDYYATYQNGAAGESQNIFNREASFTLFTERRLLAPLQVTSTMKALRYFARPRSLHYSPSEAAMLGAQTKDIYEENTALVQLLADEYDFTPYFFWQPTVYSKQKPSVYETGHALPDLRTFFAEANYTNTALLRKNPHFTDLSALALPEHTVFLDDVHMGRDGNTYVAEAIADELEPALKRRR